MKTETTSARLPSLDGWRAVSIALVLLDHSAHFTRGFPEMLRLQVVPYGAGMLGVRLFFVISGFLITWLMLCEKQKTGSVSLSNFYIRRGLRIFPVYFVYLGILGFLTAYTQNTRSWVADLTFTSNFLPTPFPAYHLWSLAVEEQFYLVWPALFLFCGAGTYFRKSVMVLMIPLLTAPVFRLLTIKSWYPASLAIPFQPTSFFCRYDSLAMGCLCAVLLAHKRDDLRKFFIGWRHVWFAGLVLILAPFGLRELHLPIRLQETFFDTLQGAGFSLLLLHSVLFPERSWYRMLNLRAVAHIGVLSYSIYIWQQIFCGTGESVFASPNAWWTVFPWWLVAALVAAHLSYFCLERPCLKLRARFRRA